MRLEINYKKKKRSKKHKLLEAEQYATKQSINHWRNHRRNKRHIETNDNEWSYNNPKFMGHNKSSSERKVYSKKNLISEKTKMQINYLIYTLNI